MGILCGERCAEISGPGTKEIQIASFTRRKKTFRLFIHQTATLLLLVCIWSVAAFVDSRNSGDLLSSIKVIFRNDKTVGNTAELSRRLADFETLGLLGCLTIRSDSIGEIYSTNFKAECQSNYSVSDRFKWREGELTSIEGEKFFLRFRIGNRRIYDFYFAILFLLTAIIANGLLAWYFAKIDFKTASLEREEENNRILEEKVREQSTTISDMKVEAAVNESLANLAAKVSHDIRSPLSALSIAVAKLDTVPDENRALIVQVAKRISGVADDLLRTYRKDRSTDALPTYVFADVIPILRSISDEKRLELSMEENRCFNVDLDSTGPQICKFNEKTLGQAVSNILNNAFEACQGRGTVSMSLQSNNENTLVRIVDSGVGIPPEILASLGSERVSFGKSGPQCGNGFGFLNSKRDLEAMGGVLEVQSEIGRGTVVSIKLPK